MGRGVERIHVVHVVDAAHLLFDRSGHRLFDGLSVGARVHRCYLNFGRRDLRKQRHGQPDDSDPAHNHHQDGDDYRHDRTVDEEF